MDNLIAGKWTSLNETFEVNNPYDNSVVDIVPKATRTDVERALAGAVKGYKISRELPTHKRIEILYQAAQNMKDRAEELARTIATEGSKTIGEARKEVARATVTMTLSAEEARRTEGETIPFDNMPGSENRLGYYYRMPIGIVAAITPFNDPLNLVAHKVGPAIAGGNACVLKPASVTPLSGLKLAECLLDAGLPPEILSVVTGPGGEVGEPLASDDRVRMVSFTGGVEAGKRVASVAGIKKIGMELGSNSPTIVMADADLPDAVECCVSGAFWAVGQNCIGLQRLLVQEAIFEEFRNAMVERTQRYKVGYQLDESTDMGPMITEGEAIRVEEWVNEAVEQGAHLLTGGERKGTLVDPTIFEAMPEKAKLDCQEVFGPVVSLYPFKTLEEAVEKANEVEYGLQAGIFTRDLNTALKAAYALDCGGVMINDTSDYRVDIMPFGGIKYSGLGREGVKFALQEMTEPKVVCFRV